METSNGYGTLPPEASQQARRLADMVSRPVERFLKMAAAGGVLLLIATAAALIWANSPWSESYHHFLHTKISLSFGSYVFSHDVHFWVNEVLMVVFFFAVGLEVRWELHEGSLSDAQSATLPLVAALGGMVVPALVYLSFNYGTPAQGGWGVPTATDIAFAVGILMLLGDRIPQPLRILLLALAIIDDIGAILIIAFFYTADFNPNGLLIVVGAVMLILLMQRMGVRRPMLYIVPGVIMWVGMHDAGIHTTITGVLLGLLTPVRPWFGYDGFIEEAEHVVAHVRELADAKPDPRAFIPDLKRINRAQREAIPPAARIEPALHPWVAFGIIPLFALANAGVTIGALDMQAAGAMFVAAGTSLGLIVGKPLGILAFSWAAIRLRIGALPQGVNWGGMLLMGCTAGIGFTMSLFIAELAFDGGDPTLDVAKVAVLIACAISSLASLALGYSVLSRPE